MTTRKMTEEEMIARIEELEKENELLRTGKLEKLKNGRLVINIKSNISNQKELAFIYPHYSLYDKRWEMSSVTNFNILRSLAMSTVDKVCLVRNGYKAQTEGFQTQKVRDLSDADLALVVSCAEEIVHIVAKYKKKYLLSVGREDIIKAFDME